MLAGCDREYTCSNIGCDPKTIDMRVAVVLAQIDRLDGFIGDRRAHFAWLRESAALEEFFVPPEATPRPDPSWFGLPLTLREGMPLTREALTRHLDALRIGTRLVFAGNLLPPALVQASRLPRPRDERQGDERLVLDRPLSRPAP